MKRTLLLLMAALCLQAGAQVTVTVNGGTVVNSQPQKYGVNVAPFTNYDSGMMFKNILANNIDAGGEPYLPAAMFQIQAGGTQSPTQCQTNINNTNFDSVAANFWVGGTITFYTPGAAPGSDEVGSSAITANTVTSSSPNGATYTYSPGVTGGCVTGNIFTLSKNTAPTPIAEILENPCTGTGTCLMQTGDLCASCGTQTFQLNGTAGSVTMPFYLDSQNTNEFILVSGGTWTWSYWLKLASGSGTVAVSAGAGRISGCSWTDTPTGTWTQYTHTCTPTETGTGAPSTFPVTITASSGLNVYMDNLSFEKTSGGDATNTTIYSDAVINTLRTYYQNSPGGTDGPCRYGPHPAGTTLADWTQTSQFNHFFTNPGQGFNGVNYTGSYQMVGLLQFLQMAQLVGCTPHLILPITLTVADAQGLSDYLSGGSGTTYGALRIAQGQTAPWTSVFSEILGEFGNENWNNVFLSQAIGFRSGASPSSVYSDYMGRAHTIFTAIRNQPSYSSNFKLMTGVGTSQLAGSTDIGEAAPDFIPINGYTQISVSDYSTTALLWAPAMTQPYSMNHDPSDSTGFYTSVSTYQGYSNCGPLGTAACIPIVYEQNVSTQQGSISQSAIDSFVNAEGYGVITAQQYFQNLLNGVPTQSLYSLTGYSQFLNSKYEHFWGDVVDMGGATSLLNSSLFGGYYTPRPQMLGAQIANECNIGEMISATIASPDTYTLPTNNNGVHTLSGVPYEYAYAFKYGSQVGLCLINVDWSSSHTVNFSGSAAPTAGSTVTKVILSGSIGATNEATANNVTNTTAANVYLITSTLTNFQPSNSFTLPPNSVTALLYTLGSSPTNIQSQGVTYQGVKIQ